MAKAVNGAAMGFTVVYGLIFAYVTFQVFVLVAQRHRKTSFKMGFNVFTMLWCVGMNGTCAALSGGPRSVVAFFAAGCNGA